MRIASTVSARRTAAFAAVAALLAGPAALPAGAEEVPAANGGLHTFASCDELVSYVRGARATPGARVRLHVHPYRGDPPGRRGGLGRGPRVRARGGAGRARPLRDQQPGGRGRRARPRQDRRQADVRPRRRRIAARARRQRRHAAARRPRSSCPRAWASGMLLAGDRLLVLGTPALQVRGGQLGARRAAEHAGAGGVQRSCSTSPTWPRRACSSATSSRAGCWARASPARPSASSPRRAQPRAAQPTRCRCGRDEPAPGARRAWRKALRARRSRLAAAHAPPPAARATLRGAAVGCHRRQPPERVRRRRHRDGHDLRHRRGPDARSTSTPSWPTAASIYASPTAPLRRHRAALDPSWYSSDTPPPAVDTVIHRFDTSSRDLDGVRGSGQVRGTVLNQFAMSELDGVLRVATTELPPGGRARCRSSDIAELRHDPAAARRPPEQLGRVGGLGKGERIYAMRFIGDRALRRHVPAGRPAVRRRPRRPGEPDASAAS